MKRMLTVLLAAMVMAMALALPANAASGTVICDYNFEDGQICLDNLKGTAEVAEEKGNHVMKCIRNEEGFFQGIINEAEGADFDMSVRVRLDRCTDEQWNWVKLCFRAPGYDEVESYHMHLYTTRAEFAAKGGPNLRDEMKPVVDNTNATFRLKNWYTIEIMARGDTMTAFVNGKQVLTMTDTDFTEGGFTLCSWGWDFSVDDLKIVERSASDPVAASFKPVEKNPVSSTESSTSEKEPVASEKTETSSKTDAGDKKAETKTDEAEEEPAAEKATLDATSLLRILGIIGIVIVCALGAVTVIVLAKKMPAKEPTAADGEPVPESVDDVPKE